MSIDSVHMNVMLKTEAIARLVDVFRQYGYDGTSMAKIAEATGLGKSSLYHHFPGGKEEMATAVLDYLSQCLNTGLLAPLQQSGEPLDRLRAMNRNIDQYYNHGQKACLLAMLAMGESSDRFRTQVSHILNSWIEAIAEVLIEADFEPELARQRAEDAIIQIQGAIILTQGLSTTAPFKRILNHLPETLLQPVIPSGLL
ncbi:TetR/AcrR family transcriptional regulator [Oculatella sp. LEGE 06141]|uniref:TetR/AcrR family transcriptional regulator n=1 Tax=Oculatella sp. LEGE 06141 TaxID=1828648 RepID=UPI001D14E4C0|nr:TetR/AcrR family transcriptional regulator [Oculatella sp. LEGE 06141]